VSKRVSAADVAAQRAAGLARLRAVLLSFSPGEELAAASEAASAAARAVVEERVASLPEAQRPIPGFIVPLAESIMADLGHSWSPERHATATPAEKAAHQAIQDLWLLVYVADAGSGYA
jgi:hypothetical protein